MVDTDTLASILGNLRNCLAKLEILAALSQDEFMSNFTHVESAKHLLQVSVECCLDIAHHIIAAEGYRTPADYYDALIVLRENGILPPAFMPALRQMVSFRNRLVHLYWDVDEALVYRILQDNLGDFDVYIKHILDYQNRG